MKLENALDQIEKMADDDVIFAKRPWTLDSEALGGELDANYRVPQPICQSGFAYFLEAPLAREVLDALEGRNATTDERRSLLMFYAENDAYPDWIFPK
jgi:hypothetical protein